MWCFTYDGFETYKQNGTTQTTDRITQTTEEGQRCAHTKISRQNSYSHNTVTKSLPLAAFTTRHLPQARALPTSIHFSISTEIPECLLTANEE